MVKTGGRVKMDTFELRGMIFAIRANTDWFRKRMHILRRNSPEAKTFFQLDDESFRQLNARSRRVILTLERHMKRANRALAKAVTPEEYALQMNAWKAHLRSMWLHIAYFKPMSPVVRGRKAEKQKALDELMQMAADGVRDEGFQPPEESELRRMMRLFAASTRRGRQGYYSVSYVLHHKGDLTTNRYLGSFVLDRLNRKELPKS
jgi:hypothetical protein